MSSITPSEGTRAPADAVPHRALLAALLILYCVGIAAQMLAAFTPLTLLPSTESWLSGMLLPSALGFVIQATVALAMAWAFLATGRSTVDRPLLSRVLTAAGWIYVLLMAVRVLVGAFGLSEQRWFDGALPTVFHFVLATFVLVFAHAIGAADTAKRRSLVWSRFLAYPTLISGSFMMFVWLVNTGSPLLLSSYLAVMLGTMGVIMHESFNPARAEWRPDQQDVLSDGVFLLVVQIGLPAVLKVLISAVIIVLAGGSLFTALEIWPHAWPLLAQIALMMVIAEFFRYWLHRLMHEFNPLWRLHAVHHASDKLYTVNVGRFHPLDKAIQFFGDSLPFLLLGVGPEVFAAYFVIYAVNGFYQHSNADVRLGPLNWIVAGPELHRWHHSTVVQEGHANYGNNLIIWDAVFGTRMLPRDRTVEEVGIGNKKWPRAFFAQIIAPLTQPTEHDP